MSSTAFAHRPAPRILTGDIVDRSPRLTAFVLTMLACTFLALALQFIDARSLASGIGIWVKPAKFFFSVSVFALTAAWFCGYVHPDARRSSTIRRMETLLIGSGTFELAYICLQAARGLESHFNHDTPFATLMYALMGIAAVLLVATTLPLAWEIVRRPAPGLQRSFVAAVATGLVLTFLLGGGLGGYMSSQAGHSVGPTGGHVPIFGWNRLGGDLRIAHFLGIHAEQAIAVLGLLVAGLRERARWILIGAGSFAYAAVTIAIFAQAIAGRPPIAA
jgi:hypothetical protein